MSSHFSLIAILIFVRRSADRSAPLQKTQGGAGVQEAIQAIQERLVHEFIDFLNAVAR
jgi:hypothetical protein